MKIREKEELEINYLSFDANRKRKKGIRGRTEWGESKKRTNETK